eukprot:jgi/Botrbrau1/2211/Bobra.101_2s0041.1
MVQEICISRQVVLVGFFLASITTGKARHLRQASEVLADTVALPGGASGQVIATISAQPQPQPQSSVGNVNPNVPTVQQQQQQQEPSTSTAVSAAILQGASQAGSYEEYIEELRRKYPCNEFKSGFPFVGGGDEAVLQRLYEACHGKPPSGYNSWEAYWKSTVGRPDPFPENFPWPMASTHLDHATASSEDATSAAAGSSANLQLSTMASISG